MTTATPMETDTSATGGIDEGLYSRQLYVLGHEAMKRMAVSNVLLIGCNGNGVETAKNLALAGVKSVTIQDTAVVQHSDLASQFYLSEADLGQNRAAATVAKLRELNNYVTIECSTVELTHDFVKNFQVVVVCGTTLTAQVALNDFCHDNGIHFIAVDTWGVFGKIFVDFGPNFSIVDLDGEPPVSAMLAGVTQDEEGIVTLVDEARHGLETGAYVRFMAVNGMGDLNALPPMPIKVLGPFTFSIGDTRKYGAYINGGYMHEVKQPTNTAFLRMRESIAAPELLVTDFAKDARPPQLHLAVQALDAFQTAHGGAKPRRGDKAEFAEILANANAANAASTGAGKVAKIDEDLLRNFVNNVNGDLSPMAAIFGGIAAQEVLKACSGKFSPIKQWLYYDCAECLPSPDLPDSEFAPIGSRYDAQIAVIGKTLHEQLTNLRYFLVGAGAIGCEMIKNWGMMGIASGPKGMITITDMDLIEKSNLSRQFLFRSWDVQKLKSETAATAIVKMNPAVKVKAMANRVGPETEEIFDDDFFENLDGVCNALDNVPARLYMDQRCIYYNLSLLESGTLSTKGNVQVVVPHMTESYGSSRDPPEKSIPICTLKNFPNQIEHTIQWARDEFEGLYKTAMEEANAYLSKSDYLESLKRMPGSRQTTLAILKDCLVTNKPTRFEQCITWARLKFEELFDNNIKQLMFNFPVDMTTASGGLFWSGPKRPPTPIQFDAENPLHMDFIVAGANLRAANYGLKGHSSVEDIRKVLAGIMVPEFTPRRGVKIQANESENAPTIDDDETVCEGLTAELPSPSALAGYRVTPVEFEKDDDENFHVDFITACSNLRGCNYNIPNESRHGTKMIAGKIIPAIATTTAIVTGFVCLELLKIMQKKKLEDFKNAFFNLALPFFTFSEPIEAPKRTFGPHTWTLWDRFDIQEGDMNLQAFVDYFKNKYELEIVMISCGVSILYSNFMAQKKLQERLGMKMSTLATTVSKIELTPKQKYLIFEVCCTDSEGEDVETPYVRFRFR